MYLKRMFLKKKPNIEVGLGVEYGGVMKIRTVTSGSGLFVTIRKSSVNNLILLESNWTYWTRGLGVVKGNFISCLLLNHRLFYPVSYRGVDSQTPEFITSMVSASMFSPCFTPFCILMICLITDQSNY